MNEEFLYFLWQSRLCWFNSSNEALEIINPGNRNYDQGPDFFNAKIKIGNTIWAGNIEIHTKASDWYLHNHDKDERYNNVILHVVAENDTTVINQKGSEILTLMVNFDKSYFENYKLIKNQINKIPCSDKIKDIDISFVNLCLNSIAIERFTRKSNSVSELLEKQNNSWEDVFYQLLARNFGFSVNSLPFELLSRSIPLKVFAKHKNSLLQIEALLFGQAGLLAHRDGDEYYLKLRNEYQFLKNKYNLTELNSNLWKYLRLRPANFPDIRLAQFAKLIYNSSSLFSKILNINNIDDIFKYFEIELSGYWDTHFCLNKISEYSKKSFGIQSIRLIIINTIVPVLFSYGIYTDNEQFKEKAIELLEKCPSEENSITKQWKKLNICINNALISQSVIYLQKEYCDKKKCIHCQIGQKLIKTIKSETN